MPIAPALLMAGATVAGGVIASNGAKKQANAIQQTTNDSNALQLQIFQQQRADQRPWMESGQRALSRIEQMLGIQAPASSPMTPAAGGGTNGGMTGGYQPGPANDYTGDRRVIDAGLTDIRAEGTSPLEDGTGKGGPAVTTPTTQPTNALQPDYSAFYESPGYQFRMQEGVNALNANAATRGSLQSGATLKALQKYGQNYASNEFGQYMNQLFNVAGLGQTSTNQNNALSSNYANNVSNNNMASAQARASSYGTQANAWGNALGTVAGIGSYYLGGRK